LKLKNNFKNQLNSVFVQIKNEIGFNLNKIVVLNKTHKRIGFAQKSKNLITLSPIEIFNILLYKNDIQGIGYNELLIDQELLDLKVIKSQSEIIFTLHIQAEFATVNCELNSLFAKRIITQNEVIYIVENNYLIKEGELIPVSNDSIKFAELLLENLNESNNVTLLFSLELFSKRENNRFLKFVNQQINIKEILGCDLYSGNSSLFIRNLYDYQKEGLKWLQYCAFNKIGGILGDDMGLGKTAQIIALVAWIIEKKVLDNVLIVVPSTLLENWKREFMFFTPSLKPYLHHGVIRSGSIELLRNERIIITSYSMIINDQYLFNKIKWGAIILDEASLIKNPNSERKISLSNIDADIKIAMTGTPVENSLIDLWSICDFVLPGYLGTIESFSAKYIKRNIEQTLSESDLISLRNDVSFIMLRRKKEDVLDSLPDKIDIHQALQMNENEVYLYNIERENILSKIGTENSSNILTLIQNLRQFTTHPLLLKADSLVTADLKTLKQTSLKFSRTIEIIDEIKGRKEKVIIFTEYLQMIDAFRRVLQEHYSLEIFTIDGRVANSERQNRIDQFSENDGFGIMILNPKTAGMGLNITAANHVIHYTRQWNPALEQQASARSYRNKQSKKVNVYYLYYVNTIEELITTRLRAKSALSGEVITITDNEISFDEYINSLSKTPILK
jgi:SNF2 family DNA or RNA helicase